MLTLNCQLHIALNFYLKCLNHSHRKICLKELEKSSKVLKPLKKASIWAMSYYVPVYFFYKFVKFNVCLNSKIAQGRSKAPIGVKKLNYWLYWTFLASLIFFELDLKLKASFLLKKALNEKIFTVWRFFPFVKVRQFLNYWIFMHS